MAACLCVRLRPVLASVARSTVGRVAVGDAWRIAERARIELSKFGLGDIQFERRIRELSGGETTKVLLAGLMLSEPQFIILDEPTNNLDLDSRHALYEFIHKWPRGALLVSHDRTLLNSVDQIAELFSGSLKIFGGNYTSYAAQRQMEDNAAARSLYDRIARFNGFIRYDYPLE